MTTIRIAPSTRYIGLGILTPSEEQRGGHAAQNSTIRPSLERRNPTRQKPAHAPAPGLKARHRDSGKHRRGVNSSRGLYDGGHGRRAYQRVTGDAHVASRDMSNDNDGAPNTMLALAKPRPWLGPFL